MTFDREHLQRWYREAMQRRLAEMRGFRERLAAKEPAAYDAARAVAQALRGSGATFGYEELSAVAGHVESAPDVEVLRRMEGLIEHVRLLATDAEGAQPVGAEWLELAAGGRPDGDAAGHVDLAHAWRSAATGHGLDLEELATGVATLFGLETAQLSNPKKAALRLVPEALIRTHSVLPVAENSETITVATADPTSLELELELERLTGRTPRFVVATPAAMALGIEAALDRSAEPTKEVAPKRAPRPVALDPDTERVLVVDDEQAARLMARSVLERGGYAVDEAGDGLEALERLALEPPVALIVADLNMPGLDGLELIWEVRQSPERSHIPVIVVTGETDEILETKLIEEGADDYIRKPLDPRLFLARVAATIRRAEQ